MDINNAMYCLKKTIKRIESGNYDVYQISQTLLDLRKFLFGLKMENEIELLLRQSYILEQQKRGYDDYLAIDVLLDHSYKNNCAKVKEGMLFYYHPYEIGCGADGQYNLIINLKTK